ncbi:hypothetical protein [Mesorhizobium sp.]|uniref:hypothetical protein n=1 Tax=Mesorhizobium sp. TaxID=1871066 RepID=UPI0025C56064|nr:hypothetical protein [Mesorhizobium sp.]
MAITLSRQQRPADEQEVGIKHHAALSRPDHPAGQLILNKQMKVVNTWTSVRDYRRTKSGGRSKTIQRSVSTISPPDWVYRKRNWSPRIAVWARFVSSRASMIC